MAKPKHKTIDRGPLTGTGVTIAEAKADLATQIDAALAGSYDPIVLSYGRFMAIVYREPQGWSYVTMGADLMGIGMTKHQPQCTHFVGDKEACIQSAGFHIIQNGCNVEKIRSVDDLPEWLDAERRQELIHWCRWQRAARHARHAMPDADTGVVHAWACENERDPRFA